MRPQFGRHRRKFGGGSAAKLFAEEPFAVIPKWAFQCPGMSRIQRIWLLDAQLGKCLSDRLEELGAVLFYQRLEEGHAQHLTFALVDARRQEFVHIVTEQVSVQERSPAVRLHEQFDRRFLLCFAAKDLGNDALHLAAVASVNQCRTPVDQRVTGDNQTGHPAKASLDQFTRGNLFTISHPELSPWNHAGHHGSHASRGVGTQRDAPEVQSVVGDRQTVTLDGFEQVFFRNPEVLEDDALVVSVLERPQTVFVQLKVFILFRRQVADQDSRLAVDQTDQSNRSSRNDVGNEKFLAVDDVMISVEYSTGSQRCQVGTGTRLG